jgi:uncharacterized protein
MGPGQAARLRIYIRNDDVYGNGPLADALVFKAQELDMAGAVAIRSIIGFGHGTAPHPTELILSRDLPVIVEIVDARDKIDRYVTATAAMLRGGLVTVEPVEVLGYETATNAQG